MTLTFFHGPMDCGKSTLALQVDHNQSRQGRRGLLDTGGEADVHYQVLCRAHHRSGDLGPAVPAPGQLTIR
jgi:hypothetical protein